MTIWILGVNIIVWFVFGFFCGLWLGCEYGWLRDDLTDGR